MAVRQTPFGRATLLACLCASLLLASCGKPASKSGPVLAPAQASAQADTARASTALPEEIGRQFTAPLLAGSVWLDFPFNTTCPWKDPNDWGGFVGLFFKPGQYAFPQSYGSNLLEKQYPPSLQFGPVAERELVNAYIADLLQNGLALRQAGPGGFGGLYCLTIQEASLGVLYASYKDGDGRENRGLVRAADFVFDSADFMSEFDKLRPSGITSKHRKYKLHAHLSELAPVGSGTVKLYRDLVIYYDPEDTVWKIDPNDGSNWEIGE